MKKSVFLLTVVLILVTFSQCKKDSEGNPIIPGITNSMTAKVNGVLWTSVVRTCTKSNNTVILTGTSADGKIIELHITPSGTETLTTNVNYSLSLTSFYKTSINTATDDIYFAVTGTAKLSELDLTNKLISGTFSFSASSTNLGLLSITDGEFTDISFVVL